LRSFLRLLRLYKNTENISEIRLKRENFENMAQTCRLCVMLHIMRWCCGLLRLRTPTKNVQTLYVDYDKITFVGGMGNMHSAKGHGLNGKRSSFRR